jgi:hypothetical protein
MPAGCPDPRTGRLTGTVYSLAHAICHDPDP